MNFKYILITTTLSLFLLLIKSENHDFSNRQGNTSSKHLKGIITTVINGTSGDDFLQGTNGDDIIYGFQGNDELIGGNGKDVLYADEGNDILRTGAGFNERLYGGDGDDLLISNHFGSGQNGNNNLYGGKGNDNYLFETNSQISTIHEESGTTDAVSFTSEIALKDLEISKGRFHLVISLPTNDLGINTDITLVNQLNFGSFGDGTIERLIFNTINGYEYYSVFEDHVYGDDTDNVIYAARGDYNQHGGLGNDIIHGNDDRNYLHGDAGNDTLHGGDNNDTIYGGDNNDLIHGENGEDTIYGDEGNDDIRGGDGKDVLYGGDGNDVLRTGRGLNERLYGEDGDDLLISNHFGSGQNGNNNLYGGKGNDNYLFETNSQISTIHEESGTADAVSFTSEIALADLEIFKGRFHLVISLPTNDLGINTDITLVNQLNIGSYGDGTIERLIFNTANGYEYYSVFEDHVYGDNADNIIYAAKGDYNQHGGLGNDIVYGNDDRNNLHGDEGNDTLHGGDNNDTIYGGDNNDLIHGENGEDVIYGDGGNDDIRGGDGKDVLYGGDGNDVLRTGRGLNERLYGEDGDDLLISNHFGGGQNGNNNLYGGKGNDNYLFETNSQISTIHEESGTADAVSFTSEIALKDLEIFKGRFHLVISLPTNDLGINTDITLVNQLNRISNRDGTIERLIFNTANGYEYYTVFEDHVYGDDADNVIYSAKGDYSQHGGLGNDVIYGNGDRNNLYGDEGNDRLTGGENRDKLYGGQGNDALFDNVDNHFDGGDGNDTVNLSSTGNGVIVNFQNLRIDNIPFSQSGYIVNVENIATTYFDDQIITDDNNNSVFSYTGNDIIETLGGNDLIYTSADAEIDGGEGIDGVIYTYETVSGVSVNLETGNVSNTLGLTGTVTNITNVLGTNQDDTIVANSENNILRSLNGNDTIKGGAGVDQIFGDDGDDRLYGGAHNDILYGGSGKDHFVFESATIFSGIDRIKDFSITENDVIDLSGILVNFDSSTDSITDFVQIAETNSDSVLSIDISGTGNNFVMIAILDNVVGISDVQNLYDNGHLVISY